MKVETHGTDRYDRTIGTVLIDSRNVNLEMVVEGWAWRYKAYSNSQELAHPRKPPEPLDSACESAKIRCHPGRGRRMETERKARGSLSVCAACQAKCRRGGLTEALPIESTERDRPLGTFVVSVCRSRCSYGLRPHMRIDYVPAHRVELPHYPHFCSLTRCHLLSDIERSD